MEHPVPGSATTQETAATAATPSATPWPLWKRIGFRFLALYFLFYTFPFPFDLIPWLGGKMSQEVTWFWREVALWTGEHVVGIEGEIFVGVTGSGDTTLAYLQLLVMVVFAVAGALLWSAIGRRRPGYPRASRFLIAGCAFYLGLVLLAYGFAKVIPTQFSPPSLHRLLETYGASSPMGLVWTFMGLAPAYTIFSGLMEVIPGFLLFFRRTRLLGACLAAGVMTNVALLNYAFDVPVKLYSSHLLLMAIALLLLHGRRLAALFLTNRPAPPAPHVPLFPKRWMTVTAAVLATVAIGHAAWGHLLRAHQAYNSWGAGRDRPETYGIHDVETFLADGEEIPPLLTDETRWRAVAIDRALPIDFGTFVRPGSIAIQRPDGSLRQRLVVLDEDEATFTFLPPGHMSVESAEEAGEEVTDVLRYRWLEPGRLRMEGTYEGRELEVTFEQRDMEELLLISRGFHWINERPLNR